MGEETNLLQSIRSEFNLIHARLLRVQEVGHTVIEWLQWDARRAKNTGQRNYPYINFTREFIEQFLFFFQKVASLNYTIAETATKIHGAEIIEEQVRRAIMQNIEALSKLEFVKERSQKWGEISAKNSYEQVLNNFKLLEFSEKKQVTELEHIELILEQIEQSFSKLFEELPKYLRYLHEHSVITQNRSERQQKRTELILDKIGQILKQAHSEYHHAMKELLTAKGLAQKMLKQEQKSLAVEKILGRFRPKHEGVKLTHYYLHELERLKKAA